MKRAEGTLFTTDIMIPTKEGKVKAFSYSLIGIGNEIGQVEELKGITITAPNGSILKIDPTKKLA